MFENVKTHQIITSIGFILIGIAWFLPVTIDSRLDPTPQDEWNTIDTINYGLVSGIFYLNLFLILVPLVIGNYGKGTIAKVFIVLTGLFTLIVTKVSGEISTFNWGGPISGYTGSGMLFLLFGDIVLTVGAFLTTDYFEKADY